jgi:hypothetical protein
MFRELPTTVYCVNPGYCGSGAAACAYVGDGDDPEVMFIETDYLASRTAEEVAGTMVHESGHTKGWRHFGSLTDIGYRYSVNATGHECMEDLAQPGGSRHSPWGEAEQSPVGGTGGEPFHLRCPAGTRATGITVDASTIINRLQLRCSDGSVTARTGEYKDSTTTITHVCPAGSSLVMMRSRSDSMLRSLRSYCAPDAELEADDPTPTMISNLNLGGAATGTLAWRTCPTGMAVIGAVGRSGARIDQVRWICGDIDGDVMPNPHPHGYRGTKNGSSKLDVCAGRGALRALYGRAGGQVNQVAGECDRTVPDDATGVPRPSGFLETRHGLDLHGGGGGTTFNQPCVNDSLVVGLQVRSGARIDAIAPVCADVDTWTAGTTWVQNVPLAGGTSGTLSTLLCPSREFVVGLQTWAAHTSQWNTTTVHGVQPICRRLDVP